MTPIFRLRRFIWCGYRDSNPGPHPWQGCALTAELHPHGVWSLYDYTGVRVFYQASVVIKLKFVYVVFAVFQAADTYVAF